MLFSPAVLLLLPLAAAIGPLVQTSYGEIEGFEHAMTDGSKADVFLGIRYANAPDAMFRFEKPDPVDKWLIRHHATHFRAACIPFHRSSLSSDLDKNYSEDCLFLNIIAPKERKEPLPVLVFIHGGGFEVGETESIGYKALADQFVSQGVIVVTVQYRLGPLGFFTTGDSVLPGNQGLWDVTLALTFLQEVLPAFGGNPDRVTVSGHSAGAIITSALVFSPHADFLFQQAIHMSGALFTEVATSESVVKTSLDLAKELGCGEENTRKIHDCMKERTIDEIHDAVDKIGSTRQHLDFLPYHLRFDKDFLPHSIEEMAKLAPKKPTVMGVTNMESALFGVKLPIPFFNGLSIPETHWHNFTRDTLEEFIGKSVATEEEHGVDHLAFRQLVLSFYADRDVPKEPTSEFYLTRYSELLSDLQFIVPSIHEMELKRKNGWSDQFFYVVNYDSAHHQEKNKTPVKGVHHADEMRLFIDDPHPLNEDDRKVQRALVDSLVAFIKTGSPSLPSQPWLPVTADAPLKHMSFDVESTMKQEFRKDAVEFWTKTVPSLVASSHVQRRLPAAASLPIHTEL